MSKKGSSKNSAKESNKSVKSANPSPSADSQAHRNDLRVPIQLLVDYKAGGHYLFDFCRDLGAGGVFIETSSPLSAGAELDLTFTIPDSKETLKTKAKVIWSQQPIPGRDDVNVGMGVQFTHFDGSMRKKLDDFVNRHGASPSSGPQSRRAG